MSNRTPRPVSCRLVPSYPRLIGLGFLALTASCKDEPAVAQDNVMVAPAGTMAPPIQEDAAVTRTHDAGTEDMPVVMAGGAVPPSFDAGASKDAAAKSPGGKDH